MPMPHPTLAREEFLPRRRGRRQPFGAAVLFLLAAAGGEWIVHQLQYLIEYGSRFGAEMRSSPHRLFMGPLGSTLALSALLALALVALILSVQARRRRSLLEHLPGRLRPAAGVHRPGLAFSQVALIALVLFVVQVAIYVTQENLESGTRGLPWPGFSVLFAAGHLTVLPLHALIAVALALILTVLLAHLAGSGHALRVVEALVLLLAAVRRAVPILPATGVHLPSLRLSSGRLGLRSPPLP